MRRVARLMLSVVLTATALVGLAPGGANAEIAPGVDALWDTSTAITGQANWPEVNPVEVGVKFVTTEEISIVGVRFHKGDQNIGPHSGSLWSSNGTQLAHATFVNETVDGWQDVLFDDPVPMEPGQMYIASYHVPVGYYSAVNDYFETSITSGPVTALSGSEADGNGVYTYGDATAFPEFTYRSSNYWVTPLWTTNRPPYVTAGADTSGSEGSAIALTGIVTDPDNDAVTTNWSITSGPDDGGTCAFADPAAAATTITCTDNGTVVATLTASDGTAAPVSDSVTVAVGNVAPGVVLQAGDGAPVPVGRSVQVSGTVVDAGTNDTQTCQAAWGDGTTSGPQACSLTHMYTAGGVYRVTVTVTDDDGGSSTGELAVVVYDPSAGFATGGGWFESPPGAYIANRELAGKATFGFTSQYKKGATVPTGATEFQLSARDFRFHASSYDWLVVTGGNSANFKGTGSLNGVDGYKFMIWASDRSPDTFRIRIWSESGAGEVVYDNGGEQALSGGQIMVHVKK